MRKIDDVKHKSGERGRIYPVASLDLTYFAHPKNSNSTFMAHDDCTECVMVWTMVAQSGLINVAQKVCTWFNGVGHSKVVPKNYHEFVFIEFQTIYKKKMERGHLARYGVTLKPPEEWRTRWKWRRSRWCLAIRR